MPYRRMGIDMQKNGLDNRSREKKVGLWIGGISTFLLISFFLVPFYLPEGVFQNYQEEQMHSIITQRMVGEIYRRVLMAMLDIINQNTVNLYGVT